MFKPEVNEDIDFQIFPPPSTDDRDDFKIKPDKKDLIKKISLKHADITPIHKKNDTNDKNNYRPVSILPFLSKPFKKFLYDQIYVYTDSILSKAQCSFRKGYSTQYSIIAMIEK